MLKLLKLNVQRLRCFWSVRLINIHLCAYTICLQGLFVAYNLAVVYELGKCIISITLQLSHINYFEYVLLYCQYVEYIF